MLYAYYLGIHDEFVSLGLLFAIMNYTVHVIMYFYFTIHPYLSKNSIIIKFSYIITLLQTLQMFIAIYAYLYRYFVMNKLLDIFGLTMYSIYGYLFSKLLLEKKIKKMFKKKALIIFYHWFIFIYEIITDIGSIVLLFSLYNSQMTYCLEFSYRLSC